MYIKNLKKKYQEKWENTYLIIKNARAFRALRRALDPGQYWLASLACLHFATLAKSRKQFLPPLDQMLDPLVCRPVKGFQKPPLSMPTPLPVVQNQKFCFPGTPPSPPVVSKSDMPDCDNLPALNSDTLPVNYWYCDTLHTWGQNRRTTESVTKMHL